MKGLTLFLLNLLILMEQNTMKLFFDGGVVRGNNGQLVKHLRDATTTEVVLHYAWNNRDNLIKVGKGGYKLARLYFDSKEKNNSLSAKFRKAA